MAAVHESILVYRGLFYLKVSTAMVLIAVAAYVLHTPAVGPPNGGTPVGYALGVWALGLIVWLAWLGVRKRHYGKGRLPLEDWLSAHVYLGLGLLIIATLHSGFQFGWNVHTLAYALMVGVIGSGTFGVYTYARYPKLMTENRRDMTLRQMMARMAEIDVQARGISGGLSDETHRMVMNAAEGTRIGGSWRRQLSGRDPDCPTARAVAGLQAMVPNLSTADIEKGRLLLALMVRKDEFTRRARRDVQFKALMDIWLYFHVPLTFALLAALVCHIVAVFFYW
jgi:hypothetical protein